MCNKVDKKIVKYKVAVKRDKKRSSLMVKRQFAKLNYAGSTPVFAIITCAKAHSHLLNNLTFLLTLSYK